VRRDDVLVTRLDDAVNAAFEPLRGRSEVDRAAALVSNLADYGLVWVLVALVKARRRGPDRRRAIVALGAAGVSSFLVNRGAKSVVGRERPEEHLEASVRTPTSSSFPSGHTLAAFCTAIMLAESPGGTAASVGFASAVAASRVHLRAHHPSDVLGGAAIGSALGLVLRPVVDVVTPSPRRKARRPAKGMASQDYVLKRL
jgi:undecaprenyl-diphosphatase